MNSTHTSIYKVLPFACKSVNIPGHEIARKHYDWMGPATNGIKHIVFSTFSTELSIPLEIVVRWQEFSEYTKRSWPKGGSICAVLLEDGRRIYAEGRYAGHTDESYFRAPIICRDAFRVVLQSGGNTLIEVVGVGEWLHSKRDAAATEKFLVDPWARDNAEFYKRYPQEAALGQS